MIAQALPRVASRQRAFAQTVRRRYRRLRAPWPPLGFHALRLRIPPLPRPAHYEFAVHVAPQVHLALEWSRVVPARVGPASANPLTAPRLAGMPQGVRDLRAGVPPAPITMLVQRITVRTERRELALPPTHPLVRHAAPVETTSVPDVPGNGGHRPATRFPRAIASSEPHPAVSAALDISSITDQVLRTIDRRIVAQRERLGRI